MRHHKTPAVAETLVAFSALEQLSIDDHALLFATARRDTADCGAVLFEVGDVCSNYLLIESGSVRVHLLDENGREIVLYRLRGGDTCVLTTTALLGRTNYAAYAIAEEPTAVVTIPLPAFDSLIGTSEGFRRFVFASHAGRLTDLMQVISDVTFGRIQTRLARVLLQRSDEQGRVPLTHDGLAVELGTAREVVSRNLKPLERAGVIKLGLSEVLIIDRSALMHAAEGATAWQ